MSVENRPNLNAVGLMCDILAAIEHRIRGRAKAVDFKYIMPFIADDLEKFVNQLDDKLDIALDEELQKWCRTRAQPPESIKGITNVINYVLQRRFADVTPIEVNHGECHVFAEYIQTFVEGAEIVSTPGHSFLCYQDRYYDAEAPNGVDDWRKLPIFKRIGVPPGRPRWEATSSSSSPH